jgi:peptide deformylase
MAETAVAPIVLCGDPVLRRPAEPVDPADLRSAGLRRLIARMRATMEAAPGVGLAAPQVGEAVRLAVLSDGPERWSQLSEDEVAARERTAVPFTVLVNPEVVPDGDDGRVGFFEGCLSVPQLTGVVNRHRTVRVDALDEHGRPFSRRMSGWPARIVQHDVDHLSGVLYLDLVETRSLSTVDNHGRFWSGRDPAEAAASLGFDLETRP